VALEARVFRPLSVGCNGGQLSDDRSMVTGLALSGGETAFVSIDPYLLHKFGGRAGGEDEVEADPSPEGPRPVVPPGVDPGLVGVHSEQIDQTQSNRARIRARSASLPWLRPAQVRQAAWTGGTHAEHPRRDTRSGTRLDPKP
jgi:hypothetical protein